MAWVEAGWGGVQRRSERRRHVAPPPLPPQGHLPCACGCRRLPLSQLVAWRASGTLLATRARGAHLVTGGGPQVPVMEFSSSGLHSSPSVWQQSSPTVQVSPVALHLPGGVRVHSARASHAAGVQAGRRAAALTSPQREHELRCSSARQARLLACVRLELAAAVDRQACTPLASGARRNSLGRGGHARALSAHVGTAARTRFGAGALQRHAPARTRQPGALSAVLAASGIGPPQGGAGGALAAAAAAGVRCKVVGRRRGAGTHFWQVYSACCMNSLRCG